MNIGIVLSGGMAKGAYQVGALRAINNFIPPSEIKYMSCASVGVLNGYAYATGKLDNAAEMWSKLCDSNARLFINQLLRSSLLQSEISELYGEEKIGVSKFYCTLFDLGHRSIIYKELNDVKPGEIPLYLKASVAMPVYNRAVLIGKTHYYDGALIDNIPVFPLLKHNVDYIICIYFDDVCYKFENTYFDNKVIKLTFPSDSRVRQSLVFRKDSIDAMISDGYERTSRILSYVFSEGYENIEAVYRAIEKLNSDNRGRLRITGDVLVSNMNKVTQRLTKRKIL